MAVQFRSAFDEEEKIGRTEHGAVRGIHRDFEAFAFGQTVTDHRVVKLDLVGVRRATEGTADEAGQCLADGGLCCFRRELNGDSVLELTIRPHRTKDRNRHSCCFRDLGGRDQFRVIAVKQAVPCRWPALMERPGDLDGLHDDRRSDCRDRRIGVVDEVPALRESSPACRVSRRCSPRRSALWPFATARR